MIHEIRSGDWREALADVGRFDAVITDPPYSERTHASTRADYTLYGSSRFDAVSDHYAAWSPDDAVNFVVDLAPRCGGWFCVLTDHVLAPHFEAAMGACGRYVFAPVPVIERGRNVRLQGDGPACWALWLIVSRPKAAPYSKWGALPGGYVVGRDEKLVPGGKGVPLMRAIIRDYTRPGDLIVDPCAGGGTTILAAEIEGRGAIGAEIDPDTAAAARARLGRGVTRDLFAASTMTQGSLL